MARNQSRDYATMDDDERRRFAGTPPAGDEPQELDFTDPRGTEENQGHSQMDQDKEAADPEHRDGLAAQLKPEE
jgi:hypothetical protein